jgi:hypothetical protein
MDRNRALLDEGLSIIDSATSRELTARLLGGAAILLHCPAARARGGSRLIGDIDVIVAKGQGRAFSDLLVDRGYKPETRFNALHGHQRMVFHGPLCQLDVLIGSFEMCHTFEMSRRLALDHPTIPVTDLLLTKLQIVELNEKDSRDALDLLEEHAVEEGEGDCVSLNQIAMLVSGDWGLWRTITGTLRSLSASARSAASPEIMERLARIEQRMNETPKSLKFKMRARVGERVPWYVLPDEVQ